MRGGRSGACRDVDVRPRRVETAGSSRAMRLGADAAVRPRGGHEARADGRAADGPGPRSGVRRAGGQARRRRVRSGGALPSRDGEADGRARPARHHGPGSARRRRRRLLSYVLALEEVAVACASHAVVMSVNNSLVCAPLAEGRHPGAARALPRAPGLGPRARLLRPDRAAGGLGRAEPDDAGAARRRRLRARRPQGVRHERPGVDGGAGLRADGSRQGASRHLRVPRREGHAGLPRPQGRGQARAPRVGHGRVRLRGVPGARGEPPRAPRARDSSSRWRALDGGRIGIAAQAVGIGRAALEASVALREGAPSRSGSPSDSIR